MCGLAGVIDLKGRREPDRAQVARMGAALTHRGPDEDRHPVRPRHRRRLAAAQHRRLGNGQQPIFNEDRTVAVICNGELFDYPERKAELQARGHQFPHRQRLRADRASLRGARRGSVPASEGPVCLRAVRFRQADGDPRARSRRHLPAALVAPGRLRLFRLGDQGAARLRSRAGGGRCRAASIICSRSLPSGTRRTMFEGVQSILPGHYLRIAFRRDGRAAEIVERRYLDLDFPDWGDEEDASDPTALIDEFEATFRRAVEIRLSADVPVVGYLSGGVDSAYVLATAAKVARHADPELHHPGAGSRSSTRQRTCARSRRAPSAAPRPWSKPARTSSPRPTRR